jgi:hypothetical protein
MADGSASYHGLDSWIRLVNRARTLPELTSTVEERSPPGTNPNARDDVI